MSTIHPGIIETPAMNRIPESYTDRLAREFWERAAIAFMQSGERNMASVAWAANMLTDMWRERFAKEPTQ